MVKTLLTVPWVNRTWGGSDATFQFKIHKMLSPFEMKSKQNSGFLTELYPGFGMLFIKCCIRGQNYCRNFKVSLAKCVFVSPLFGWTAGWATWVGVHRLNRPCQKPNALMLLIFLHFFNSESQSVRRLQGVLQSFLPIFYFKVNVAAERPHPLLLGKAYRRPSLSWLVRDTQADWLPSGGVSVKNTWRE